MLLLQEVVKVGSNLFRVAWYPSYEEEQVYMVRDQLSLALEPLLHSQVPVLQGSPQICPPKTFSWK